MMPAVAGEGTLPSYARLWREFKHVLEIVISVLKLLVMIVVVSGRLGSHRTGATNVGNVV